MKKLSTLIILYFFSLAANAECTAKQANEKIRLTVTVDEGGTKAGGNHGYMDKVIIEAPASVAGVPLAAMELTEDEVASYWIPVAYKIVDNVARTEINGYRESIKNFEIAVYYESKSCNKSIQRLLIHVGA